MNCSVQFFAQIQCLYCFLSIPKDPRVFQNRLSCLSNNNFFLNVYLSRFPSDFKFFSRLQPLENVNNIGVVSKDDRY